MTEEQKAALRAVLAKQGLQLAAIEGKPDELTWPQLHEQRKTCRRILTGLSEQQQLNASEQLAFDTLVARVASLTDEIDERESLGSREPRNLSEVHPAAARGQGMTQLPRNISQPQMRTQPRDRFAEITPLGRGERLADRIGSDQAGADIPIGQLLRASMSGDWEGLEEFRAQQQQIGVGADGGFLAPSAISARVIDLARNRMRAAEAGISIIPATSGQLSFGIQTGDPTAHWVGENAAIPESKATFGLRNFTAHATAILVRTSVEFVEDAVNGSALIEAAIADQIALKVDYSVFHGNGIGEPLGLLNHSGDHDINRIVLDGPLTNYQPLSRAVQACSENNFQAGDFVLAARTAGELDRLVDQDGNPLMPPRSVQQRRLLDTNQVRTDLDGFDSAQGSPGPVAIETASAIFTGNWPDYFLVVRTDLQLEASRVAGDAFGKRQVMIRGYLRCDGFSVRPKAFAAITGVAPPVGG
jgi:HK97 family phage major capsid protein